MSGLHNTEALRAIKIRARGNTFNLGDVIKSYRVLLIGIPGAFTPVDTHVFMPELIKLLPFLDQYIDYIFCIAWNDPFVTKAWVQALQVPKKIKFISDWNGYVTKSLGMQMDASEYFLGMRSKRYAAIYEGGQLLWSAEADDAYPSMLKAAIESFVHWRPSNGEVDPCSAFNTERSPKSKFTDLNFLPVSSMERKSRLEDIEANRKQENPETVPSAPAFKIRFGSPRSHQSQNANSGNGSDMETDVTSSSDECVDQATPNSSLKPSYERLHLTTRSSSQLSDVELVQTRSNVPRLKIDSGIESDEVMQDNYLRTVIDEVLDDMIVSTECTESLGLTTPRSGGGNATPRSNGDHERIVTTLGHRPGVAE